MMTNNVEKLYELAGVKLEYRYSIKGRVATIDNCNKEFIINFFQKPTSNFRVTKANKVMNFTTEKQLELIKWLVNKNEDLRLNKLLGSKHYRMGLCALTENVRYKYIGLGEFNEALAGLVINLWQDLTDEQKQEVKGILE